MGMGAVAMVGASFLMAPKPLPAIPTPIAVEPYEKTWKLPNGTPAEQYVLAQLQEHTESLIVMLLQRSWVTLNRKASLFLTYARRGNRVPYESCHSGGYGLIQWTSIGRYNNLGKFCEKYNCDPSSLEGQTRYMINENVFRRYLPEFEGRGKPSTNT